MMNASRCSICSANRGKSWPKPDDITETNRFWWRLGECERAGVWRLITKTAVLSRLRAKCAPRCASCSRAGAGAFAKKAGAVFGYLQELEAKHRGVAPAAEDECRSAFVFGDDDLELCLDAKTGCFHLPCGMAGSSDLLVRLLVKRQQTLAARQQQLHAGKLCTGCETRRSVDLVVVTLFIDSVEALRQHERQRQSLDLLINTAATVKPKKRDKKVNHKPEPSRKQRTIDDHKDDNHNDHKDDNHNDYNDDNDHKDDNHNDDNDDNHNDHNDYNHNDHNDYKDDNHIDHNDHNDDNDKNDHDNVPTVCATVCATTVTETTSADGEAVCSNCWHLQPAPLVTFPWQKITKKRRRIRNCEPPAPRFRAPPVVRAVEQQRIEAAATAGHRMSSQREFVDALIQDADADDTHTDAVESAFASLLSAVEGASSLRQLDAVAEKTRQLQAVLAQRQAVVAAQRSFTQSPVSMLFSWPSFSFLSSTAAADFLCA